MIGEILDKLPDWILIILAIIMILYFVQIIVGLFLMSNHLHYPRIKINNDVDEWSSIVWLPLRLYFVWIFTDKLTYIEL